MKKNQGHTNINRLTRLAPIVLFLTSYLPLFVLIIVRQLISNSRFLNWGGIGLDSLCCMMSYFGMSIICLLLIILGVLGSFFVFKNLNDKIENGRFVRITEVSSMNDEPLAYIATYIIPILFQDYSNLLDCITIVFIFYIVYRLYVRSKLLLVNPILSLKFSIYNFRYLDGDLVRQGVLISKDNDILEDNMVKIYNVGYQLFYGYKRNI